MSLITVCPQCVLLVLLTVASRLQQVLKPRSTTCLRVRVNDLCQKLGSCLGIVHAAQHEIDTHSRPSDPVHAHAKLC